MWKLRLHILVSVSRECGTEPFTSQILNFVVCVTFILSETNVVFCAIDRSVFGICVRSVRYADYKCINATLNICGVTQTFEEKYCFFFVQLNYVHLNINEAKIYPAINYKLCMNIYPKSRKQRSKIC